MKGVHEHTCVDGSTISPVTFTLIIMADSVKVTRVFWLVFDLHDSLCEDLTPFGSAHFVLHLVVYFSTCETRAVAETRLPVSTFLACLTSVQEDLRKKAADDGRLDERLDF